MFGGVVQRELPSYRIQIEQSTPDRIKHVLQPVRFDAVDFNTVDMMVWTSGA